MPVFSHGLRRGKKYNKIKVTHMHPPLKHLLQILIPNFWGCPWKEWLLVSSTDSHHYSPLTSLGGIQLQCTESVCTWKHFYICIHKHIYIYKSIYIYCQGFGRKEKEGNPSFHLDLNGKTWFALGVRFQKRKEWMACFVSTALIYQFLQWQTC